MLALLNIARGVAARLAGQRGRQLALTGAAGAGGGLIGGLFGGGDEDRPRRRRRKNVLTASDRADIAFIAGSLGKPAGRDFAMIVAARI